MRTGLDGTEDAVKTRFRPGFSRKFLDMGIKDILRLTENLSQIFRVLHIMGHTMDIIHLGISIFPEDRLINERRVRPAKPIRIVQKPLVPHKHIRINTCHLMTRNDSSLPAAGESHQNHKGCQYNPKDSFHRHYLFKFSCYKLRVTSMLHRKSSGM